MANHDYAITTSDEYKSYIKALAHLAGMYVPRIRNQFAAQAYEKYQDETTRKIVIAYGKEAEKLEADRLREFEYAAHYGPVEDSYLDDSCLNHAGHYRETINMLFGIH